MQQEQLLSHCTSLHSSMLLKDNKKKAAGKLTKKNKDLVNMSGSKSKKKWFKGKVRDKLDKLIFFNKMTYDKLCKEVPKYKLIILAVVSKKLNLQCSLVRAALQESLIEGLINLVSKHRA